jgi:hypothetical protein
VNAATPMWTQAGQGYTGNFSAQIAPEPDKAPFDWGGTALGVGSLAADMFLPGSGAAVRGASGMFGMGAS